MASSPQKNAKTVAPRPKVKKPTSLAQRVVRDYSRLVWKNYSDVVVRAEALQKAIDAFLKRPGIGSLRLAKQRWIAARKPYGQSEVFRFYEGPIDHAKHGVEGQVNAWPLDEAYIDYVNGNPKAGVINAPQKFKKITQKLLMSLHEKGDEKNVATGYHALEFLLWGQDMNPKGPGNRPFTDYVEGPKGTAKHQRRRKQYLRLVTALLVADLRKVKKAWTPNQHYAAQFVRTPHKSIVRILTGMQQLSGDELAGERMAAAYRRRTQEQEQSCFSDNTHADLLDNALGVQNVYLGRYGTWKGVGLTMLMRQKHPKLDQTLRQQLQASISAIKAIPVPFDRALITPTSRVKIKLAIDALHRQAATLKQITRLFAAKK